MTPRAAEWRARLAMVLFSSGLGLGLLEGGARLLGRLALGARGATGTAISEPSATLGWRTRPGGSQRIVREDFDVTVTLNAHGLRGPNIPFEPPAGRRRLAVMGDSFAHGYYALEEETLAGRLRAALAPCAVDVVNGGGPGYSTDQEWLFFTEEIARYRPTEVVLLFYYNDLLFNVEDTGTADRPKPVFVEQDGRLVLKPPVLAPESASSAPPPNIAPPPPVATFHGSALWALLASRLQRSRPDWSRVLASRGLAPALSVEPPAEFLPFGPRNGAERARVDAMWRRTGLILAAFRDAVRERGAGFSVFYVPARFEANDEAWTFLTRRYEADRPWRRDAVSARLGRMLSELDIPLVDANRALAAAEASGPSAYLPVDGHWNARGNAIAFETVLPLMRRAYACAR